MAHLNNAVGRASDTGPQVGALLGDGAGDGRSCDGNNEVLKLVSQDLQDVQTIHGAPFISPLGLTMTPALSSK